MAKRDVCSAIGNYGRGMKIKDFNPKEVKIGMEVEKEHTLDECIREKIVLDHLSEIDDYYTRLVNYHALKGVASCFIPPLLR